MQALPNSSMPPPPTDLDRLQKRLDRERAARRDTEAIAEKALAELYAKQMEIEARQNELRLMQAITVAANQSDNLEGALQLALDMICEHTGWPVGHAWRLCEQTSPATLISTKLWHLADKTRLRQFCEVTEEITFPLGVGLPGDVWATGLPKWIENLSEDGNFPRAALCPGLKLRSGLALPIMAGMDVVTVIEFFTEEVEPPNAVLLDVLTHVGSQLGRVVERERGKETVRWQAYHDSLTGLPNRTLFLDRCTQALSMARRHEHISAVLFLDIDRFKQINDTFGHKAGDDLLREIAMRFQVCLRNEDTLARMGGDEFTVLLPNIGGVECVARVAGKLQETLTRLVQIEGQDIFVSTSIGVSLFPADGQDVGSLLQQADAAMYRTKRQGGGSYQLFAANMNDANRDRLALEGQLRQALIRHEFVLFYQPQVDTASGSIVGVEALVRWRHPEMGLVPPTKFIPLAEDTGLILPMGNWILQEAIRQAAAWRRAGYSLRMSVNLSARQFERGDLAETVGVLLSDTGLPPSGLELELTESTIMAHGESVVETLSTLKRLGLRLAIDDFGTGYSSLAYLRRFPLDVLKIDRAFVRGLSVDEVDTAIVKAVIDLAHAVGLEVVAEGVELNQQRLALAVLGCDILQGYLFSQPLPASEVEVLLGRQLLGATPGHEALYLTGHAEPLRASCQSGMRFQNFFRLAPLKICIRRSKVAGTGYHCMAATEDNPKDIESHP